MSELSNTTINGVSYDFKDAGAARQSHSHTKSQITDFPTSMPASDVSAWAKESTKPSYTASEVGAIPTTDKGAANGVASLDSTGKVPSSQLPSSGGGVNSVKVGSTSYNPDSSGVVSLPSYPTTLPANGGTASNVSGTVTISHGGTGSTSASGARSNLGLGTAATKSSTSYVTSGSSSLITSGGVYNAIGHLRSLIIANPSGSTLVKTVKIPSVDCALFCFTGDSAVSPTTGVSMTNIQFYNGQSAYGVHSSTMYGLTSNDSDTAATLRVMPWNSALLLWNADVDITLT